MKMKNIKNIGIVGVVIVAATAIMLAKQSQKTEDPKADTSSTAVAGKPSVMAAENSTVDGTADQEQALPRLIDFGASTCIPCKMMKPILDDLKVNYADTFTTEFTDVWEDGEAGKPYKINLIPTQIFFDADGKELFRHEGFYSKDDILEKWKEFGVEKVK